MVNNQAIVFHPFAYNQFQLEAETVLNIVKSSLTNSPTDEVAVLVRNRSHLRDIAQLFKQHNIHFESLKTTPLKEHYLRAVG
ncbi:ATP-dependent nuclease subunit A [hydrothermal vent metagenome]|uniref:ATP-dependent nuclease subunit A n=1 Tax=hydrothermal vent metagenome TaxID=652676 RepID=A0A1W1DFM4_9ZZZZ